MFRKSLPHFSRILLLAALGAGMLSAEPVRWAFPTPAIGQFRSGDNESWLQPTATGELPSSWFGCVRNDGRRFHEGLDIGPVMPRKGRRSVDPVMALHDGIVVHVNRKAGDSSYGIYVVLEHPTLHPSVYTLYAHLHSIEQGIEPNRRVEAGSILGVMGNTAGGYVIPHDRSHLHLEIGLRLSSRFEAWFDRQAFGSANQHGNFNGMNLIGWDPLAYLRGLDSGATPDPMAYLATIDPALVIHVLNPSVPDFLLRYPGLELPGCAPEERVGWEIMLSGFGLPISFRALRSSEIRGVQVVGDVSVVGINRIALDRYPCRDLVREDGDLPQQGPTTQRTVELLFGK